MADEILGSGFIGVVYSDFYGAYSRPGDFPRACCGAHLSAPPRRNRTERDVRPMAADRKVTGATRWERGSKLFADWMTVTQTLPKHGIALRGWIRQAFDARIHGISPPSVFAQPQVDG